MSVSLRKVVPGDRELLLSLVADFNKADGIDTPVEVFRPALVGFRSKLLLTTARLLQVVANQSI